MRVANVILRTNDMTRATRFWAEQVGLAVVMSFEGFLFLDAGSIQLIINEVEAVIGDGSLTEVVFEVDDVIGKVEELQGRGISFEVDPRPVTSRDGMDLLATHFHDPDGHLVSVTGWVQAR